MRPESWVSSKPGTCPIPPIMRTRKPVPWPEMTDWQRQETLAILATTSTKKRKTSKNKISGPGDIQISIHFDSAKNTTLHGISAWSDNHSLFMHNLAILHAVRPSEKKSTMEEMCTQRIPPSHDVTWTDRHCRDTGRKREKRVAVPLASILFSAPLIHVSTSSLHHALRPSNIGKLGTKITYVELA